jgi:hypothetical protein
MCPFEPTRRLGNRRAVTAQKGPGRPKGTASGSERIPANTHGPSGPARHERRQRGKAYRLQFCSLLENLTAGKTRQIPVDFLVRLADTLGLTTAEKDALVRSWAFGIEKRSWRLTNSA